MQMQMGMSFSIFRAYKHCKTVLNTIDGFFFIGLIVSQIIITIVQLNVVGTSRREWSWLWRLMCHTSIFER